MSNELTTQSSTALDLSGFNFDVSEIKPSNMILIQGDNPMKDKIGCKNGEFVADNVNFGSSIECQPVLSEFLIDVWKSDPTVEGGPGQDQFIETIKEERSFYNAQTCPVITNAEGDDVLMTAIENPRDQSNINFPLVCLGNDGRFYQRKKVLIVAVNGMPYRMVFKSRSKMMSYNTIMGTITKSLMPNKISSPVEGIFKIFSEEKVSNKNKKYYTLNAAFVRAANDDELVAVAPFRMIDAAQAKEDTGE
jgi:hypothetical protein